MTIKSTRTLVLTSNLMRTKIKCQRIISLVSYQLTAPFLPPQTRDHANAFEQLARTLSSRRYCSADVHCAPLKSSGYGPNSLYYIKFWARGQARSQLSKHAERVTDVINGHYMLASPFIKQIVSDKCHKRDRKVNQSHASGSDNFNGAEEYLGQCYIGNHTLTRTMLEKTYLSSAYRRQTNLHHKDNQTSHQC